MQNMQDITLATIYLMGASFVFGSMITLLALLLLDFMRRDRDQNLK